MLANQKLSLPIWLNVLWKLIPVKPINILSKTTVKLINLFFKDLFYETYQWNISYVSFMTWSMKQPLFFKDLFYETYKCSLRTCPVKSISVLWGPLLWNLSVLFEDLSYEMYLLWSVLWNISIFFQNLFYETSVFFEDMSCETYQSSLRTCSVKPISILWGPVLWNLSVLFKDLFCETDQYSLRTCSVKPISILWRPVLWNHYVFLIRVCPVKPVCSLMAFLQIDYHSSVLMVCFLTDSCVRQALGIAWHFMITYSW